ncbi:hypothetical protein [Nitrospina gracilis]|uniref:hypothetical protein n=1 Tax=Nitrospina gracilis TaxID=35801 RepID=UPI001F183534|nr:hypothetical protein [Nitrospina gracilis]MCF8719446.1 hypothetical protein [Nitrospina gracilis Nb-211]
MVKFCLQCKDAFWGGQFCPNCEGNIELLDAAVPENQKYLSQLNIDVRPKYFARSSMLLTCFGFVMALPLGMFVFLRGASASGNVGLWATVAISLVLGVAWLTWWGSAKVFSRKMKDVHTLKEPQLD